MSEAISVERHHADFGAGKKGGKENKGDQNSDQDTQMNIIQATVASIFRDRIHSSTLPGNISNAEKTVISDHYKTTLQCNQAPKNADPG
jgi:hypothetical protein